MATCHGTGDEHCCSLGEYGTCHFLRDDGPDAARRWVCTLREEHGNWADVHTDARYLAEVRPKLDEIGVKQHCGNWPQYKSGLRRRVKLGEVDPCAACCWGESWRP